MSYKGPYIGILCQHMDLVDSLDMGSENGYVCWTFSTVFISGWVGWLVQICADVIYGPNRK